MKKVITLIVSLLLIALVTFSSGFINLIPNLVWRIALGVLANLLNGAIAFVAIKITKIEIGLDLKNWKSYLIGFVIAAALCFVIGVVPTFFGVSFAGQHTPFTWFEFIYSLLFFVLIVGPVEELVFRVYVQETFMSFFGKHKWIGIIIASALFGLWHIINGSLLQVLFTFGIGLVFGFAKYLLKNCKYVGVATAHGLYDFSLVLVKFFILH